MEELERLAAENKELLDKVTTYSDALDLAVDILDDVSECPKGKCCFLSLDWMDTDCKDCWREYLISKVKEKENGTVNK